MTRSRGEVSMADIRDVTVAVIVAVAVTVTVAVTMAAVGGSTYM